MVKMVNPTPCSKGQAMATSRNNGIQDHLPCALQSCAALEHPGCHLKNVPCGGLCLGSGDSVCQPGSTAGTGVGVCVILPVLASPLQPQRTQVPCPAPGMGDTGSPRKQSRRGRAACACAVPWAGSVLLTHTLTPTPLSSTHCSCSY